MTKPISKEEKKRRKEERRKRSDQQKPPSTTKTTVQVPKPTDEEPENLCDTCAYEFGACEGAPIFAGESDDRVVKCAGHRNIDDFPTADEKKKEGAAEAGAAPSQDPTDPAHEDDDKGPNKPGGDQGEDPPPSAPEEPVKVSDPALIGAELAEEAWSERPDPKRFFNDKTDYGTCPSCSRPLKRTAFNRYNDGVRCTNPRCPQYRAIVKKVSTGVR